MMMMCTSGSLTGGPRGSQITQYCEDPTSWHSTEYGAERRLTIYGKEMTEMEHLRQSYQHYSDKVRPEATFADFVAMSNELDRLVATHGSFLDFLKNVTSTEWAHLRELTERVGLKPFTPQDVRWLTTFGIDIPDPQEKIHVLFRILDLKCTINNERYRQDHGLGSPDYTDLLNQAQ
jgi:hypothetical protein